MRNHFVYLIFKISHLSFSSFVALSPFSQSSAKNIYPSFVATSFLFSSKFMILYTRVPFSLVLISLNIHLNFSLLYWSSSYLYFSMKQILGIALFFCYVLAYTIFCLSSDKIQYWPYLSILMNQVNLDLSLGSFKTKMSS